MQSIVISIIKTTNLRLFKIMKPEIFFKEEQLEEIYSKDNQIKVPTNQTQYTFDTKDNLELFIKNQFPTDEEFSKGPDHWKNHSDPIHSWELVEAS